MSLKSSLILGSLFSNKSKQKISQEWDWVIPQFSLKSETDLENETEPDCGITLRQKNKVTQYFITGKFMKYSEKWQGRHKMFQK